MERLKPVVFPLLVKVLAEDGVVIRGIYERNDVSTRKLEGLQESSGWFPLENDFAGLGAQPALSAVPAPLAPSDEAAAAFGPTTTEIIENGVRYHVDFENGQKTGFFLDQKYNRRAVANIARGRRVLDCFTHTGSFALNAAAGGAEHVHAVDISQLAVDMAESNARLNGFENRMSFQAVNVFDLLPEIEAQKKAPYDFIILDPPAFTKSRKTIDSATRGYHEINYRAMKALPRGGYLATCSCSHFMDTDRFRKMLVSAGARCRRSAAPNRGTPAIARPSHRMGRARNRLPQILLVPGCVKAGARRDKRARSLICSFVLKRSARLATRLEASPQSLQPRPSTRHAHRHHIKKPAQLSGLSAIQISFRLQPPLRALPCE